MDLLVGYRGVWSLAEVKSGSAAVMQPSQVQFLQQALDAGCPFYVLDHLDDVDTYYPIAEAAAQSRDGLQRL